MDYKDKYEQALERARTFSQRWQGIEATDSELALRELKEIFPELKESEDERIKKEIIAYLESVLLHKEHRDKTIEGWISWLKTQGEHANFRNKIQIGDEVTRNEDGALVNLSQFKRIVKQGEQKPTDKVEPKFKVGDWIYHEISGNTIHINKIENALYVSDEGATVSLGRQNNWRLWTIQDAKDGDVLVFDDAFILIFKEIVDLKLNPPLFKKVRGFYFKSYANLDFLMNVFEQGSFCCDIGHSCHPATKEQRDLLFTKMKEAGVEWDAVKKELKKVESKSAWSEDDEKYYQGCLHVMNIVLNAKPYPYYNDYLWLKSLKERMKGE